MRKNLLLTTLSVVGILLVLELALHLRDVINGDGFFREVKVVPFRMFGPKFYQFSESGLKISSTHGELVPFAKGEGTVRIVAFGGSTTRNLTAYGRAGIHYPKLVQDKLNELFPDLKFEVINVAYPSYTTLHQVITLSADVLSWDVDIVIISNNLNDLSSSWFRDFVPDYSNQYSIGYFLPGFTDYLRNWIRLWGFTARRLENAGYLGYPIRRASYGMEVPKHARQIFERNVHSFVTLAKSHDIFVILGSQPLNEDEQAFEHHMMYKPYNDMMSYPLHDEFVAHHRQFNFILQQIAKEREVLFVDNSKMNNDGRYFIDFVHYTEEGVRALADNYVDAIVEAGVVDQLGVTAQMPERGGTWPWTTAVTDQGRGSVGSIQRRRNTDDF